MGLDAFVPCRCWLDGRLPPPAFAGHILLDEESQSLCLDLPWDGHERTHRKFDRWVAKACPHRDMRLASERIGNWGSVSSFRGALEWLGDSKVPTLLGVLPAAHGGRVAPPLSARCLGELEHLRSIALPVTTLNELDSGKELMRAFPGGGMFQWWGEGLGIGLDENGVFIRRRSGRDAPEEPEVFRTREPDLCPFDDRRWLIADRPNGSTFILPSDILGLTKQRLHRLALRTRALGPDHFAAVTESLRKVFSASVTGQSPVVWT